MVLQLPALSALTVWVSKSDSFLPSKTKGLLDYADMQSRDPDDRVPGVTVGVGRAILSNRLSHFLNIKVLLVCSILQPDGANSSYRVPV